MTGEIWQITAFTLSVALAATLLMLPLGVWLAWLLARRRFPGRALVETFVSLPLVMPPVATGLILLKILGAAARLDRCSPAPASRSCSPGKRSCSR